MSLWEVIILKKLFLLSLLIILSGAFSAYAGITDCSVPTASSIKVKNSTGSDISAIYVARSKPGEPEWSKNLLKPESLLKKTNSVSLPLERDGSARLWIIKIVDTKGNETLHEHLPLSSIYDLELDPGGKSKYKEKYDT